MVSKAVLFAPPDAPRRRDAVPRAFNPAHPPVALLPVGNKPLVLHALEELVDAGIEDVAVVAGRSLAEELRELVDTPARGPVATVHDAGDDWVFMDALRLVRGFLDGDPFVLHLGDSLTHAGLADAIRAPRLDGNDAIALVEPPEGRVTQLDAGLASRRAAGVYVFGPGVLDLPLEANLPADWDLSIASAAKRLAGAGGHVEMRPAAGRWRYRHRSDALLEANRFFLSGLSGGPTDAWMEKADLQGPVALHPTVRLSSSVIRGPVIVGPGAEIRDAYIGPYTSIGANVMIENAEVEHSIILPHASIRHLGTRLEGSVVGRHARVFRDFSLPRAVRLNVSDGAEVAIT
jgi:glucose-1-phosphate thymidylyltransferase